MYKTNMGSDIKVKFYLIKEWLKEYLFIFFILDSTLSKFYKFFSTLAVFIKYWSVLDCHFLFPGTLLLFIEKHCISLIHLRIVSWYVVNSAKCLWTSLCSLTRNGWAMLRPQTVLICLFLWWCTVLAFNGTQKKSWDLGWAETRMQCSVVTFMHLLAPAAGAQGCCCFTLSPNTPSDPEVVGLHDIVGVELSFYLHGS